MDKLLTHKFWILFGLVLLVPLVAWWIGSGSVQAETATKEAEIKTAEGQVPPVDSPNDKHVAGAKTVVDGKAKQVVEQIKRLWNRQQTLMTWPRPMQSDMAAYEYRNPIEGQRGDQLRLRYRVLYAGEVQRILATVKPLTIRQTVNGYVEEGLVDVDPAQLPFKDTTLWAVRPPTSEQMWDAQEDLWLTEAILKAIADVNSRDETGKTPKIITEAPIPEIRLLMLKGGRTGQFGVSPTTSGESTETEGGTTTGTFSLFGTSSGSSPSYGEEGGSGGSTSASFDPAKVFGSDALEGTGTETDTDYESTGLLGGGSGQPEGRRYIEDEEALPYKTRGFYLEVSMRNEFVPDLMLALANMDWPASVAHVHMIERHPDDVIVAEDTQSTGPRRSSDTETRSSLGNRALIRPRIQPRASSRPSSSNYNESGDSSRANLLAAALENRAIADVAIAGVITIYKPPVLDPTAATSEPESAETPSEGTAAETPAEGTPADPAPGDSAVVDPGTTELAPLDPALVDPADPAAGDPASVDPAAGEPVDPETVDPADTEPSVGEPAAGEAVPEPASDGADAADSPPEPEAGDPADDADDASDVPTS